MEKTRSGFGKRLVATLALVCILLVSGLGYLYYSGTRKPERYLVGIINVNGSILKSSKASKVTDTINQAMLNDSVKAVVLRIDSPGGYAHLIEQIYLDVLELKREKPVVCSVVYALSGGYYIAVAADYIYAHPTSMVGNVGVVGVGPPTLIPSEMVLESGSHKVTGFSKLLFPFNLTHALDSFVSAVERGRGGRLMLSSTDLKRAMIYMGSEAVAAGLVDEVGSLQRAVKRATEEAGLVEYEVVELRPAKDTFGLSARYSNETEVAWEEITVETLNRLNPPPAVYYLYLPPRAYMQKHEPLEYASEDVDTSRQTVTAGKGPVVVDLSHGNRVSMWVLDILAAELAMRNITLGFAATWDDVESVLGNASALIVAAPTVPYTSEEGKRIEEFVNDGRMLLLFFDPATVFLEVPALHGPINSLANRFGLSFAKGYLYNEKEHYGFYRNIYIKSFADNNLTRDLSSIVFFTATHIYSNGGLTWTSSDTYSSTAERTGSYTTIALMLVGNGTVAAFGDLTFLMEPYCYVEDNYKLVMNLVLAITGIEVPEVVEEEEPEYNITEPDLPVGTEKIFTEQVDGEEHELRWVRVSENETSVERPDRTTHYHYDGNGSLVWLEVNGMKVTYEEPLPKTPYPLVEGKGWAYAAGYNLTVDGEVFRGRLTVNEYVVGFEDVEAGDGETYICAKVRVVEQDQIDLDGNNRTWATTGYSWISSEAGLVKDESETRHYVDGLLAMEETRKLLLTSIKKGED